MANLRNWARILMVLIAVFFQQAVANICTRDPSSPQVYRCFATGTEPFNCPESGIGTPQHYWRVNNESISTSPVTSELPIFVLPLNVQCNENYTIQCIGPIPEDKKYIIGPECDPEATTAEATAPVGEGHTTIKDSTDDTTDDTTDGTNTTADDMNTTDGSTITNPVLQTPATKSTVVVIAVVVSALIAAMVVTAGLVVMCCCRWKHRKSKAQDLERSQETPDNTQSTIVQSALTSPSTMESSTTPSVEESSITPSVEESNKTPSVDNTATTPVIKKGRGRVQVRQETSTSPLPTLQVHRYSQISHDDSGTDLPSPTRREPAQFVMACHSDSGSPHQRPTVLHLETVEGNGVPIHHSTPKKDRSTTTYSVEESSEDREEFCVKNQSEMSPATPVGQNAYVFPAISESEESSHV